MSHRWTSVIVAACLATGVSGCVPYGGYGESPYGATYGGYSAVQPAFVDEGYLGPDRVDGYYGRPRFGGERDVFRQQQNYNRALVAEQRQQNQVVLQQQQYNEAVVAQQNAYNQALLAQQRAALGR